MSSHKINFEDFSNWINEKKVVYASDSMAKKKLVACVCGVYQVLVNEIIVWQGIQPFRAVEEYNAI